MTSDLEWFDTLRKAAAEDVADAKYRLERAEARVVKCAKEYRESREWLAEIDVRIAAETKEERKCSK